MFYVELFKAARRWRTWLLGGALGGIPIILVISLLLSPGGSGSSGEDGPPFYELIVRNGFFTPLAALGALQVFLLPLAAALLSGDAVAGEASTGTLRYLLVRPVGRLRLILSKYAAAVVLIATLILWVTIVGLVAGGLAYGWGPMPTLSGSTLSPGSALLRIGGAAGYIATGMGALAAVGVFASTLSDSAPGASVATVALAIVSQILESLRALAPIHTFLISERWLAFVDLFRDPIVWGEMAEGIVAHAFYAVVFVALAGAILARKDVMS